MPLPEPTCTTIGELAQGVLNILETGKGCVVTIDGPMGVGKTALAAELAKLIGASHVEVDQFHSSEGPPYVDQLNAVQLRAACSQVSDSGGTLLLDGICMLEVLARVGLESSVSIVMLPDRYAVAGDALDDDVSDEELGRSLSTTEPLRAEVARYLRSRQPHLRAHILYRSNDRPHG